MKQVTIHTDGGCEGNPGPGGWAAILACAGRSRELSGGEPATTNNRMELRAAIEALGALTQRCEVDLHTDSQYLRKGITEWIDGWKRKGWRTGGKNPVKNRDLWQQLDELCAKHTVRWHWLKGHAGHAANERCDELAASEIAKIRKHYPQAELARLLAEFRQHNALPPSVQPSLFE